MAEVKGGVCAAKGFKAGGIRCGIKMNSRKKDLGLIYSEKPCTAAAMFTSNRVKAASVLVSMEKLAGGKLRAIIANSGNANACTGGEGLKAAVRMAELAALSLGVSPDETAVASTGVIGVPLPIEVIEKGIPALKESLSSGEEGHEACLEAIMTTDTRKKAGAEEIKLASASGSAAVRIGGMVKGSGMIHPNMATMLCFITTDAAISRELLEKALRRAVKYSFNRLTVDRDTSTNDTIIIMANGEAGNIPVTSGGKDFDLFAGALEKLCIRLTRAMARDGEGASRLVTVTVTGASCDDDAEVLAKSVASSSLVKAACFGSDANWGRVLCALGYAGIPFDPEKTDVCFASGAGEILVCRGGASVGFSEDDAKRILSEEEIEIRVTLNDGPAAVGGRAVVWGCDLTYDYVRINGDYRS
jgi:glutamate N-acetyltransferase/amino-acid N-acetyltransferase